MTNEHHDKLMLEGTRHIVETRFGMRWDIEWHRDAMRKLGAESITEYAAQIGGNPLPGYRDAYTTAALTAHTQA